MHLRRRALSAGAVLAAAGAIVLSGSPAQAACSTADSSTADSSTHAAGGSVNWQVGMQLGPAPLQLTGTGGIPALLLAELPVRGIAVRGAGQNVVRLDATSARTTTESASLPDNLPRGLDLGPVDGVRVLDTARAGAVPEAAPRTTVDRVAEAAAPTVRTNTTGQWEVLRADDGHSPLGGQFAWVPIEGIGLLGADGAGLPWAAGIALVALVGGTAAVTVVARHRTIAG